MGKTSNSNSAPIKEKFAVKEIYGFSVELYAELLPILFNKKQDTRFEIHNILFSHLGKHFIVHREIKRKLKNYILKIDKYDKYKTNKKYSEEVFDTIKKFFRTNQQQESSDSESVSVEESSS